MPAADDHTLGEVARNLDALAKRVDRGFERVDEQFAGLAMVHADVYLADRRADSDRRSAMTERIDQVEATLQRSIDQIDDSLQWITRTVVGIVIAAVVAGIIAAAGLPH